MKRAKYPEHVKKAIEIFEDYYKQGFLGAVRLNVSEVYRRIEYPGGMGGFQKIWKRWLDRKVAEANNKEETKNG